MRKLMAMTLITLTLAAVTIACEPVEGDFDEPLPDDPMEEPMDNGR